MEILNLWSNLQVKEDTKVNLIKDLSEGKVPQLPYFVIGIEDVKTAISAKLEAIDQGRMLTSFVIARYGNGKTNLLKYLELFFEDNAQIKVIFKRANVDQPDIGLFLLKEIQDHYTDLLIESIKTLRNTYDFNVITNGFPESFKAIKEFSDQLFNINHGEEEIKRLIYLGTGRLYTKAEFSKFNLEQLSNFERKEILVLFLNILSENNIHIIFQIDEIEKIYEKSKLRLNAFFTSYRELFDLFSFIKGHYLICSYTDANADANFITELNEAFFSRIKPHILYLPHISKREDILTLVQNLNSLFVSNKSEDEIDKIVKTLAKQKIIQNRDLVRQSSELLNSSEKITWQELIEKYELKELYEKTETELDYEGLFKSINQKFFDPLETYLEGNFLLENGSEIKSRDYQSFIDNINNKIHYFVLNENITNDLIQYKVDEILNVFKRDIILYAPVKLELKNGAINSQEYNIDIVDIDPRELFILLNMYRDNFELQPQLTKIISSYTNDNL